MDIETLQQTLYPLGMIASLAFGARTLAQWIVSERKKTSTVPHAFWIFSITGNLILALHCFIQLQYPVMLIQSLNALMGWRNLQLQRNAPSKFTFKHVLALLFSTACLTTTGYLVYSWQTTGYLIFARSPILPWSHTGGVQVSLFWPLIGFAGTALFALRFWLQWWKAERHTQTALGASFWWFSLVGAFFAFIYFARIEDVANALGYGLGIIPYIRNLILLKKKAEPEDLFQSDVFFFAGEQSADGRGAELMQELKKNLPDLKLAGVGGPKMRAEGLRCLLHMEDFEVMGITDVLRHLPKLLSHLRSIKQFILKQQPKIVILIDYPDFNMRLAKGLRQKGYSGKIVQYVSPTVWAWRKRRIYPMAQTLDLLLSIFPFEKAHFAKTPLRVEYIGHPLTHQCAIPQKIPSNWLERHALVQDKPLLALFPGSRASEIERNFPLMLETAEHLQTSMPELQLAISCANPKTKALIQCHLKKTLPLIPEEETYLLMQQATAALATSGTVTLELGLFQVPTVVVYRISPLNAFIAKYILRLQLAHYCIVNIIAGQTLFPELIHTDFTAISASRHLLPFLTDTSEKALCKQRLSSLHTHLASPYSSPSHGAASLIGALL